MLDSIKLVNDFVWGYPMLILLVGGGIYLAILSRFANITYFFFAIKLLGKSHKNLKGKGDLTHFEALTNALSATVGLGNIAGVSIAITQGGPGAVFWMWMSGVLGMNTKFFTCSLSMMFRGKNWKGEVQGGPMYVMEKKMGRFGKYLAILFSLFALSGTLATFQANQLSEYLKTQMDIAPWVTGLVCAIVIFYIIYGGIRRIGFVTSKLVPIMCLTYLIMAVSILFFHLEEVPGLFKLIFKSAFSPEAFLGGAVGLTFKEVLIIGLRRGAFSNEAGVGTAPMAHSNAKTDKPIEEGLVAMLGPFLDTIIVCTITAFVILLGVDKIPEEMAGISLTLSAFNNLLPSLGGVILGVSTILFSFTTMLGMANYCQKAWDYLFRGRLGGDLTFYLFYCSFLFMGSVLTVEYIVTLADLGFGLMAFCNMIPTLLFAHLVNKKFKEFKTGK